MAITFLEKRKRLRYLFPILAFVVLITIIVLWKGFFIKKEGSNQITPESLNQPAKKVEINLETLRNPLLEEFQPFGKVESFEGEVGRQNPFISF